MDISKIKPELAVYADGPGGLAGASEVHIGNVERLEGNEYVKIRKLSAPDGQEHWFPVNWVRTVDDNAVFLNKKVDDAIASLMNEAPTQV